MIGSPDIPAPASKPDLDWPTLTNGTVALLNLQAQIEGLEPHATTVESRAALIDLIILRGLILGSISDYERAGQAADRLVQDASTEAAAFVARARTRAVFHRFADAVDDLDRAERLSPEHAATSEERAVIFQALGRFEEALAIYEKIADRQWSFEETAALAGLWADRGDTDAAERLYADSQLRYAGVSPFPLALLDFQFGAMWMRQGRLNQARTCFVAAIRRVPAYASAQGHLAEVEAELGEPDAAVARLYPLAISSDDPDYAAQLARILGEMGRTDASRAWCRLAAARYDELIAAHPEAFADHAAEFWLAAGSDPEKALPLARLNFEVRKTPRAYELLAQALAATETAGAASARCSRVHFANESSEPHMRRIQ
jgi:tetratricopeptide (TPR) repeat protein